MISRFSSQIKKLGLEIESDYRDCNFNEEVFSEIASKALSRIENIEKNLIEDIYNVITDSPQKLDNSGFSDYLINVYSCEYFTIQVLIWMNSTTSIHQHMFSGAFKVLQGSSLHSEFKFKTESRLNSELLIGSIENSVSEILREGDVRKIHSGFGIAHSLYHMESPSVTLLVRTNSEPWNSPQYKYIFPCFAIDPFSVERKSEPILRSLKLLKIESTRLCFSKILELIPLLHLSKTVYLFPFFAKVAKDIEEEIELFELIERVYSSDILNSLKESLEYSSCRSLGYEMRETTSNVKLRFLIATLINSKDKVSVENILKNSSLYLDESISLNEAISLLLEQTRFKGDSLREIVSLVLKSESIEHFKAIVESEFRDSEVERTWSYLENLHNELKTNPLFVPLWK